MGAQKRSKSDGVVATWNGTYGFIKFTDGTNAYVHKSQCNGCGGTLQDGQSVSADIVEDPKNPGKWQAIDVIPGGLQTHKGNKLDGVVAQWFGTFGFITLTDGTRAYVHKSECNECGGTLEEGQSVSVDIIEDPKNPGKWQAVDVIPGGLQPQQLNKLEGVVAQWSGTYGFITFTDGTRAYVHMSQCKACGGSLYDGQTVAADIVADPKNPGKWQAVDVIPSEHQAPNGNAWVTGTEVASDSTQSLEGSAHSTQLGTVTKWQGTYGFIQLEHGGRAYVHKSQISLCGESLAEGQQVVTDIVEDPVNPGKWQAVNVVPATASSVANSKPKASPPVTAQALNTSGSVLGGVLKQVVVDKIKQKIEQKVLEKVGQSMSFSGDQLEGVVSQWAPASSYGFIQFNDGRRAYAHSSQCTWDGSHPVALQQGLSVVGTVVADPKNPGKWQANDVEVQSSPVVPIGGGPPAKRSRIS